MVCTDEARVALRFTISGVIDCRTECAVATSPVVVRNEVEVFVPGRLRLFLYYPENLRYRGEPYECDVSS